MDEAYRHADADLRMAVQTGADQGTISQLERIRQLIFSAHDNVGIEEIPQAVRDLNEVIEIKLGV
jgi:hypothetical protein